MKKLNIVTLAMATAIAIVPAAMASPITGTLSGGNGGDNGLSWTATTVTLDSGSANNFGGSGDLAPITSAISFSNDSLGIGDVLSGSGGGETISFDFTSFSVVSETPFGTNGDAVHAVGLGTLTLVGGPDTGPTTALFSITGTEEGGSTSYSFDLTSPAPSPVPEPSSLVLLGSGLAGAAFLLFRRNNAARHTA